MQMTRRTFGRFAISIATILVSTTALAQSGTQTVLTQADYIFWLNEVDRIAIQKTALALATVIGAQASGSAGDAERLYREGSAHLRERYSLSQFEGRLRTVSEGRGRVVNRVFQGIDGGFRFLPNLKEGEYAIALFDVRMTDSTDIYTEQVTLARDNGQWRFVEYYIDAKPFYSY